MSDYGSDAENRSHDFLEKELCRIEQIHQSSIEDTHALIAVLREELEVYLNVIPKYEIENPNRVEQKLLHLYHKYLISVVTIVDTTNTHELRAMGASILAELATVAFAFNFHRTLLSVVVRCANDRSLNISAPCIATLKELLTLDASSRMILAILDELTDILEEIPKKIKKSVFFSPTLLRLLIMIHSKDVDMYRTIHENELQSDMPTTFALKKELKRKKSKLDKKMQLIHRTEETGDLVSVQAGLFQKVIYFLLRIFKNCTVEIQGGNAHMSPTVEQTLLIILHGFYKYGSFLNAELVDLLNQTMWDLYECIERKIASGAYRTSGSLQIQCHLLYVLNRFIRLQRRIKKHAVSINFQNTLVQRAIPHDNQGLQVEILRLIDNLFAMPLPYFTETNHILPEFALVGENHFNSEDHPTNTASFFENAVRVSWTKQIDRFIETTIEVFEINKYHQAAIASRHKRHKYGISSEVKALFDKIIGYALCSPPCISQRLRPLVKTLLSIFTECSSSARLATDDDVLIQSGERNELYWQVFAYRLQAGKQSDENVDQAFEWFTH